MNFPSWGTCIFEEIGLAQKVKNVQVLLEKHPGFDKCITCHIVYQEQKAKHHYK